MTARILLVEDHGVVRSGLRSLLEKVPGLDVVGDVGDGRHAVEACRELRPDVVLTDVEMPSLNGIEAARQIHLTMPEVKIIMLSMHDDPLYVLESLKAGASGYVLKGAASDELLEGIQTVISGQRYLSPPLDAVVDKGLAAQPDPDAPAAQLDSLSSREREVLQLLAEGRSNPQVARMIHISARTVESHRANIMQKLGIHTVAGLTKFAIKAGLTFLE